MKIFKISFNLPDCLLSFVKSLAKCKNKSISQIIRNSIGNYLYLNKQIESGNEIYIQDKNGNLKLVKLQ